jgi:hypothetical protein
MITKGGLQTALCTGEFQLLLMSNHGGFHQFLIWSRQHGRWMKAGGRFVISSAGSSRRGIACIFNHFMCGLLCVWNLKKTTACSHALKISKWYFIGIQLEVNCVD